MTLMWPQTAEATYSHIAMQVRVERLLSIGWRISMEPSINDLLRVVIETSDNDRKVFTFFSYSQLLDQLTRWEIDLAFNHAFHPKHIPFDENCRTHHVIVKMGEPVGCDVEMFGSCRHNTRLLQRAGRQLRDRISFPACNFLDVQPVSGTAANNS